MFKIILCLFFSTATQAQLFGIFGKDDKASAESTKLKENLSSKLSQLSKVNEKQAFAYLDEIDQLNQKFLTLKKEECLKSKNNADCKEELIDFEEEYLDKVISFKKEILTNNHKNNLSEIDSLKAELLKTLRDSLK